MGGFDCVVHFLKQKVPRKEVFSFDKVWLYFLKKRVFLRLLCLTRQCSGLEVRNRNSFISQCILETQKIHQRIVFYDTCFFFPLFFLPYWWNNILTGHKRNCQSSLYGSSIYQETFCLVSLDRPHMSVYFTDTSFIYIAPKSNKSKSNMFLYSSRELRRNSKENILSQRSQRWLDMSGF